MQLGIYVNAQHPAGDDPARRFAETVEQVRLIRALGFDSIWGGEHHATPGFHYFPLLPFLQRLAAEAAGLQVGTNLVLLPLHNPVEVAEIGAFLDVITGGRFLLGVGLGYRPEEFAIFGIPMAERVSRLVEGIEIIRRLWTEDGVSHLGRHWRLDGVTIRPRPLQAPRPPILVGSQVPAGIARAARIADGWMVVPVPTVDEFAAEATGFRAARAAAGLPPSPHVVRLVEVACAPDEETAVRRAAPYLLAKYAAYQSGGIPGLTLDHGAPPPGRAPLRGGIARAGDRGAPRAAPGGRHPRHHAGQLAGDAAGRRPGGPRAPGQGRPARGPPAPRGRLIRGRRAPPARTTRARGGRG
jgi:alkanesulfonate monooxygenase SsuD/methylene tetrahydromethanopterin reductase-like flavin-dependent oxidoreductase (luciferase family)